MNKPHLLQKLSIGRTTIGMLFIGFSMLLSSSARSATFPPGECGRFNPNNPPISLTCFDKTFSGFTPSNPVLVPPTAEIMIGVAGDGETFQVELDPVLAILGRFTATLTYNVQITDPDFFFNEVTIDSTVVPGGVEETVRKQIFSGPNGTGDLLLDITSRDGVPVLPTPIPGSILQFISVVDTVNVPLGGTFDGFENSFTQKRRVSEPSAILGFLIFGSLSLGLKYKK